MKFAEILGQTEAKRHLQKAAESGTFSHAYIITGEPHSGKRMMAEAFAATLLCEQKGKDACGECISCKQAQGRNNPDIIYVTHEKSGIAVSEIREQVNNTVDIRPYAGQYKIYIINEAEKMNEQAQNALLKTLEEPPTYVVFLLLTENSQLLLQTIRSRCVTLELKPVSKKEITAYLMKQFQIVDYQAKTAAAFSQGNVGKAIEIATAGDFSGHKDTIVRILSRILGSTATDFREAAVTLTEEKTVLPEYLDFILIWYKDVLLYKATLNPQGLSFTEEISDIRKMAEKYTYRDLEEIFQAIEEARLYLKANVTPELMVEQLLTACRDGAKRKKAPGINS